MTPDIQAFVEKWRAFGGAERANYQHFLLELCDLLGVPRPDPVVPDDAYNAYVFERAVTFSHGDGLSALQEAAGPATADEVARSFKGAPTAQVVDLLETLMALGYAHRTGEDRYTAG